MTNAKLPRGEELLVWMSAFLDGELGDEESALLTEAMENDPRLCDQMESLAAVAFGAPVSLSQGANASVDVADAVMAAVAPAAVSADAAGAARLASADIDDELADAGQQRLAAISSALAPAQSAELLGFVHAAEGIRASAEGGAARATSAPELAGLADKVETIVAGDLEAERLGALAVDGELDDAGAAQLAALLGPAEPADARVHRWQRFSQIDAQSEALGVGLHQVSQAPEGARAGAAALSAIQALATNQASIDQAARKRALAEAHSEAGLIGWLSERFRFLAPVAFAGAAAAVFFFVAEAQPDHRDLPESAVDEFLAQVDRELGEEAAAQRLALADTELDLLSDNHADVLSIDTDAQATLVFETEATNITVIWVAESDPNAVDDDDDVYQDAEGEDEGAGANMATDENNIDDTAPTGEEPEGT